MITLLLLLLQAAPAPRTIEDAVAAFADGDATARDEILKAGAASILTLRKIRDRAPDRVQALLYDLKKTSAGASAKPLIDAMEENWSIASEEILFPAAIDALGTGIPVLFDPTLFRTHFQKTVTLNLKGLRREAFDSFCRQTGLDYGFFFGVVLIAEPGRLWPAGPPARSTPLTAGESESAVAQIARLSANEVEERDQAYAALKKLGTGVIPLLEKGAAGGDVETRARCLELIRQLKGPPPAGVFHEPAAARQRLAGAEEEVRASLLLHQISFKVMDIVLEGALKLMLQPRNIAVQPAPSTRTVRLTLDCQNQTSWAVIALATQTCGFDFLIVDGALVVDTRTEIERRLSSGR